MYCVIFSLFEGTFTTAREMHVKILLPDFLEYVRRNYGFSLAEESGVRINNVGHALQVNVSSSYY